MHTSILFLIKFCILSTCFIYKIIEIFLKLIIMKCYTELDQETLQISWIFILSHLPFPVQNGDGYFDKKLKFLK